LSPTHKCGDYDYDQRTGDSVSEKDGTGASPGDRPGSSGLTRLTVRLATQPLAIAALEGVAPAFGRARDARAARFSGDLTPWDGALGPEAAAAAAQQLLDTGVSLSAGAKAAGIDIADLRELQLLTAKPFLYVFNMDVSELADEDLRKRLSELVAPAEVIFLDAKTEADLTELPEDEAAELLAEAGMGEPGLAQLARAGFRALGLQTFLTAGPKETRAWEIKAGATAPEAAGVIHTDFQRGFIKAEVVSFDDLIAAGSLPAARSAGKARIEGKDYVMRDGDVVEFRFNV